MGHDGFQDSIQRIMNGYKRQELADKYGMEFSHDDDANLSPSLESRWLNYIEEYERQFATARHIPLREYLDFPTIPPLCDVPAEHMAEALSQLLDLLERQGVVIDFLSPVDPREAYRFITEDLLDEEIDDIRIPGTRCHFVYEDFYPGDALPGSDC
jgi:hypothetical protein